MMSRGRKVKNVAEQGYKSDAVENEIDIDNVPLSQMLRRQVSKDAKSLPALDTEADEENMLVSAGFDLEGLSEQEKAEIMKAVLASKAEDEAAQNPVVATDRKVVHTNHTSNRDSGREKLVATHTIHGHGPLDIKQASVEDVPLKRHYRGAKTRFLHKYNYFQPCNNINLADLTKAICQLFELYQIRLQRVQKSCQEKLEWGEPVKSGQHHKKTIDMRRRGRKDTQYLDLSDDDFQNIESDKSSSKEIIVNASEDLNDHDPAGTRMENYSENELAVNKQSKVGNSSSYIRPLWLRLTKCNTVAAETQKYSFCDSAHMQYVGSTRSQLGSGTKSFRNITDTNRSAASQKELADVLVEEMQQNDIYSNKASMSDEDIIVPETQEDEEWLNASKRKGTEKFEHERHQDKSTACIISETKQKNYENHEQKEVSSSLETLKNHSKYLRNYHLNINDETRVVENESNLNKSVNNDINGIRGQKRKAEKQHTAYCIKDCYDLEEETSNMVGNTQPIGVKRLFSRPVISESTVSGDLSSTSSWVSSEMLDEKGDIYSTQFNEIKFKKGKGKHVQHAKLELDRSNKNYDDCAKEQNELQGRFTETESKQMRTNAVSVQNSLKSPEKIKGTYALHWTVKASTFQQMKTELGENQSYKNKHSHEVNHFIDSSDDNEYEKKFYADELSRNTSDKRKAKGILPLESNDTCHSKIKNVSDSVPFRKINVNSENNVSVNYCNILSGVNGNVVVRPKTRLRSKVLAMVKVSEIELNSEHVITQQQNSDEDIGVPATAAKSPKKRRDLKNEKSGDCLVMKNKVALVACPICNENFTEDAIQQHAEYCTGPESDHQSNTMENTEDTGSFDLESGWLDSSDSSCDDNITLASIIRSGFSNLVTRPWNQSLSNSSETNCKSENPLDNCTTLPDWVKQGIHSPIKSFVPISLQEDNEYFSKQFSYKKQNVERRMNKRKLSQGKKKSRKRRRRSKKCSKKV